MPIYCYKCSCGANLEIYSHYPKPPRTSKCSYCGKKARRNIAAENISTDCGDHERLSDAMGISGDQIDLARKTFPNSEYVSDGAGGFKLKIKNRAHKKVEMARRGYVELD